MKKTQFILALASIVSLANAQSNPYPNLVGPTNPQNIWNYPFDLINALLQTPQLYLIGAILVLGIIAYIYARIRYYDPSD